MFLYASAMWRQHCIIMLARACSSCHDLRAGPNWTVSPSFMFGDDQLRLFYMLAKRMSNLWKELILNPMCEFIHFLAKELSAASLVLDFYCASAFATRMHKKRICNAKMEGDTIAHHKHPRCKRGRVEIF